MSDGVSGRVTVGVAESPARLRRSTTTCCRPAVVSNPNASSETSTTTHSALMVSEPPGLRMTRWAPGAKCADRPSPPHAQTAAKRARLAFPTRSL